MKIVLDDWPIVLVTFPAQGSREEVDDYLEDLTALMRHTKDLEGSIGFIADISLLHADSTTAELRSYFAERVARANLTYPGAITCTAVVCPSIFLRGLVAANAWLSSSTRSYPLFTFDTLPKAHAYVAHYLYKMGVPRIAPPPLRREALQNTVRTMLAAPDGDTRRSPMGS